MPIIRAEKGDLLEKFENGEFNAIAHGCNCFHTMGAGIAGQISRKYPQALDVDIKQTRNADKSKLGSYTFVWIEGKGYIFNMYTQYRPGREDPMLIEAKVEKVFYELNEVWKLMKMIEPRPNLKLGIPLIGCGIAGGDWNRVKGIIHRNTSDIDVIVVEYAPKVDSIDLFEMSNRLDT